MGGLLDLRSGSRGAAGASLYDSVRSDLMAWIEEGQALEEMVERVVHTLEGATAAAQAQTADGPLKWELQQHLLVTIFPNGARRVRNLSGF